MKKQDKKKSAHHKTKWTKGFMDNLNKFMNKEVKKIKSK
jgi:hypothetical protein